MYNESKNIKYHLFTLAKWMKYLAYKLQTIVFQKIHTCRLSSKKKTCSRLVAIMWWWDTIYFVYGFISGFSNKHIISFYISLYIFFLNGRCTIICKFVYIFILSNCTCVAKLFFIYYIFFYGYLHIAYFYYHVYFYKKW